MREYAWRLNGRFKVVAKRVIRRDDEGNFSGEWFLKTIMVIF
jgi:hypothetical protein